MFAINKTKRIGKVIYVVEGQKTEINILNKLFTKILDYSVVNVRRNECPTTYYQSQNDDFSQAFIINSENSNVSSITTGEDYLDSVYAELYEGYGLDPNKAAVYYIFDRDFNSNPLPVVRDLVGKMGNSRDNGFEANGLLLLSYPCFESFIISCFHDRTHRLRLNSRSTKKFIGTHDIQSNNLEERHVPKAMGELHMGVDDLTGHVIQSKDLDDFKTINRDILNQEESLKDDKHRYRLLSLFLLSFWDLGILREIG